ncbi:flagellar hook-associated protein FlgK [bacterium]|nr:flagellar hook-associated protein FlgK [bacterium]
MIRGAFLGLETARKGLMAARAGLDTTGHNIANAGTEGYSRQRAVTSASSPISLPGAFFTLRPGMLGTGAEIISITRIRSQFVDAQIQYEGSASSHLGMLSTGLQRVEDIFGEPAEAQFSGLMDSFFNAWEDLSNDPESLAARTNLREAAQGLTDYVNNIDFALKREVEDINTQIRGQVQQVNTLTAQIAEVNRQITRSETSGARLSVKANDLLDKRDQLVEQLSKLVNVRQLDSPDGSVNILMDGHPLVTGGDAHELVLRSKSADPSKLVLEFKEGNFPAPLHSGEMGGLFELRDVQIPAVRDKFATLITAFTNQVNKTHQQGYGLDGTKGRNFFNDTQTRSATGTLFLPAGTTLDTSLDSLGITSGDFFIQGQRIEITPEEVLPGQALTLRGLLQRIESASVDIRAELNLDAGAPRIEISQYNPAYGTNSLALVDGNSNFFEISGLDKAVVRDLSLDPPYDNSLSNFRLSTSVLNSLDAIAATGDDGLGFPGPGDNRTALAIADLKNNAQALFGATYGEYFESTIAILGATAQTAERSEASQKLVLQQLEERRQIISGVNLDEEAVQLIKYQKAFEASARALSAIDETLDLIVNRMGTVGR